MPSHWNSKEQRNNFPHGWLGCSQTGACGGHESRPDFLNATFPNKISTFSIAVLVTKPGKQTSLNTFSVLTCLLSLLCAMTLFMIWVMFCSSISLVWRLIAPSLYSQSNNVDIRYLRESLCTLNFVIYKLFDVDWITRIIKKLPMKEAHGGRVKSKTWLLCS